MCKDVPRIRSKYTQQTFNSCRNLTIYGFQIFFLHFGVILKRVLSTNLLHTQNSNSLTIMCVEKTIFLDKCYENQEKSCCQTRTYQHFCLILRSVNRILLPTKDARLIWLIERGQMLWVHLHDLTMEEKIPTADGMQKS